MTVLIDGDIVLYWACYRNQQTISWGDSVTEFSDLTKTKRDFKQKIKQIKKNCGTKTYIICFTCPSRDNFRKTVDPDYKANRTSKKPDAFFKTRQYAFENFNCDMENTIEADDLMGIYATGIYKDKSVIATIDKDLLQIPGYHYHISKEEYTIVDGMEARYNFFTQVLTGDSVDNIKGVPGIGPKKAEKLLDIMDEPADYWAKIVEAYQSKGLTEEDAIRNARLCYILRNEDYKQGKVELWNPPN